MSEESPELVRLLLRGVLQSNLPFDCGEDKETPTIIALKATLIPNSSRGNDYRLALKKVGPSDTLKTLAPQVRIGNFPANLCRMPLKRN